MHKTPNILNPYVIGISHMVFSGYKPCFVKTQMPNVFYHLNKC